MKLEYRNGLLFTSIEIKHRKKSKIIDNIVIDTGAAETIISPDAVYDIGIYAEQNDRLVQYYGVGGSTHNAFVKNIDQIKVDVINVKNVSIDFGIIDTKGNINGLIGLDILMKIGAIINLKNLTISWI